MDLMGRCSLRLLDRGRRAGQWSPLISRGNSLAGLCPALGIATAAIISRGGLFHNAIFTRRKVIANRC